MPNRFSRKHVLVSCGPMRTEVDPVRFLQNRSSGKMGLELCRALANQGALVTVILGPVDAGIAESFRDFQVHRYTTASQYLSLVENLFPGCNIFFSLAAVLDFEVVPRIDKLSREEITKVGRLELELTPVPDIVARMAAQKRSDQQVIAFAAESGVDSTILESAERKRQRKNVDAIVANPVRPGLGPDADDNELWILRSGKPAVHLGPGPKSQLAEPMLAAIFGPLG